MSRGAIVAAGLVGCLLVGLVAYSVAQGGEKSLPLYCVPTISDGTVWGRPKEVVVKGRVYGDARTVDGGPSDLTFRLGRAWDLLEMRVWLDPETHQHPDMLLFFSNGELLQQVSVSPGQEPSPVSIPVTGLSDVQMRNGRENGFFEIEFIAPRVVKGRTKPAFLQDIIAGDGEIVHISTPGDYRIKYRR